MAIINNKEKKKNILNCLANLLKVVFNIIKILELEFIINIIIMNYQ